MTKQSKIDLGSLKPLTCLNTEINIFARYFERRYFEENLEDTYWVADFVGETLAIADYYFSLHDMMDFIRYDYSEADMFKYYQYSLDTYEDKDVVTVCIRDWRKLKPVVSPNLGGSDEVVGSDCMCELGSKEHEPQCRTGVSRPAGMPIEEEVETLKEVFKDNTNYPVKSDCCHSDMRTAGNTTKYDVCRGCNMVCDQASSIDELEKWYYKYCPETNWEDFGFRVKLALQDAYTKGRSDEAKICEGSIKRNSL